MLDLVWAAAFGGMKFYYPPGGALDYFVGGRNDVMGFEPEVTQYLQAALREDMVFLDVGAHLGYYTLLAANQVQEVIAFEPIAPRRAVLLENIGRNGLKNVTVLAETLFSGTVLGGMVGGKDRFRVGLGDSIETVTLDSLRLFPDAIKIDVEGAELDVLMGAEETLRACKPILAVEIHTHKIGTFDHHWTQVSDFLRGLGYTVASLGQRGPKVKFIKAEYPA